MQVTNRNALAEIETLFRATPSGTISIPVLQQFRHNRARLSIISTDTALSPARRGNKQTSPKVQEFE